MANFNVSVTQSNEPQPSGIGAGVSTTYTISNPLSGSSYFTLETTKNSNGAYDSISPKNLQGTLSGDSGITTIVSDDYKAGIVVSPGGGVLTFVPTNAITAATLRLRGTSPGFVSVIPPAQLLVNTFVARVEADGGSVENTACGTTEVEYLLNNP